VISSLAVTKVYYRSMTCFASVSSVDTRYRGSDCNAKVSRDRYAVHQPLLHHVGRAKSQVNPHSSEQDTQPTIFPISKEDAPYRTHGGTYCPMVSAPKNQSLANPSTTCHGGINHLHHSNHCSNHSIDPYPVNSHLDGW
jgi:hypothetical protein